MTQAGDIECRSAWQPTLEGTSRLSALGSPLLCNGQELPIVLPLRVPFLGALPSQCLLHVGQQQVRLAGRQAGADLAEPLQEGQLAGNSLKGVLYTTLQQEADKHDATSHVDSVISRGL